MNAETVTPTALVAAANAVRRAAGSVPIAPLLPGLSVAEVHAAVGEHAPSLVSLVDTTIERWWSEHDGLDPRRIGEGTGPEVAPDGFALTSLRQVLADWQLRPDYPDLRFPISSNEMGIVFWLTKSRLDSPWFIERDYEGSGTVPPHCDPGGEPVLFDTYLQWAVQAEWFPIAMYPSSGFVPE